MTSPYHSPFAVHQTGRANSRQLPATGHRPPATGHRLPATGHRPPAFTLVEMLIAMALTLILVYAIAQFYAIVGDAVKDGRALIELNQQLRACVERLKSDLDQVTIPIVPWADEGGAAGYFEIREGLMPGVAGAVGPATDWA